MTLVDKIKIFDHKIKANQAQYNLDREAATTFILSSGKLKNMNFYQAKI